MRERGIDGRIVKTRVKGGEVAGVNDDTEGPGGFSAGDEAILSREELPMRLAAKGLTSVPVRVYACPACQKPLALIVRPDVEVVTPEARAALAVFAEEAGVPLCDPEVDHFPDCQHCGWKPEHDSLT